MSLIRVLFKIFYIRLKCNLFVKHVWFQMLCIGLTWMVSNVVYWTCTVKMLFIGPVRFKMYYIRNVWFKMLYIGPVRFKMFIGECNVDMVYCSFMI